MPNFVERLHLLASDYADCPAIEYEGSVSSWGELETIGEALLREVDACAPEGTAVAHVIRTRPDSVAAFLSLLRAQRPVALVNHLLGSLALREELAAMRPRVVVIDAEDVHPGLAEHLEQLGTHLVILNQGDVTRAVAKDPVAGDAAFAHPPSTAFSIMTSGTTGRPKRVVVPFAHIGDVPTARRPGDPRAMRGATINALPLSSIGGAMGVVNAIWKGRPIALMDRFDVHEWAELVRRHRPRIAGAPPAVIQMLVDAKVDAACFESVACLFTGSAPLHMSTARRFEEMYGIPVLQAYGASEFLGPATRHTLDDWASYGRDKLGSVGRPIEGMSVRIVDSDSGSELAADEVGHVQVADTRAAGEPQWLSTSDLGRLDEDGFLWIQGRSDDVLMRGGFKVSRRQVAETLARHDGVARAICVALDDQRLGQVPAAAVEPRPGHHLDEAELLTWCRDRLKRYEVPVLIAVHDALPVNDMMKVAEADLRMGLARAYEQRSNA